LKGLKVLITAGGTQEAIDPVRMISNRSSGKQGFALAQAALDLGADVTLVSAPVHLAEPVGAQRIDVHSAQEMHDAVLEALPEMDVLIMAAAVADFRPERIAKDKIKKGAGLPEIRLERTPDILKDVAAYRNQYDRPSLVVGFAAESQDLLENARTKLRAKRLDLIAANDIRAVDAGFGVDTNRVTLIDRQGEARALPLMSKDQVARAILEDVIRLLKS
jgi:phosphopantothenoylcysteine decarboxylase/phosphopantothenate--cysteine ligase